jgi:GNAT superfamily N-acetyltransferase
VLAPVPLGAQHQLDSFRCSEASLESWLKQRAYKNQVDGASRTFVVCEGDVVVGYYCLSAGSVARDSAPGGLRRNMPDPIPVVVLGRLAAHVDWAGQGIGRGLLKDAILRTVGVAGEIGIRALLCHAISPAAKTFYLKYGFVESPLHPMTLLLPIAGKLVQREK